MWTSINSIYDPIHERTSTCQKSRIKTVPLRISGKEIFRVYPFQKMGSENLKKGCFDGIFKSKRQIDKLKTVKVHD